MQKIKSVTGELLKEIEGTRVGLVAWALGFVGIMIIRTTVKAFLAGKNMPMSGVVTDFVHEFFFFLIMFLLFWLMISLILRENPANFSGFFLWGAWLFVFPPLIDMVQTGGSIYWSFYLIGPPQELWGEFISFFGNLPPGIFYFGTRIVSFVALILIFGLVYRKSKDIKKSIISLFIAYCLMFFMGAFPTAVTYVVYMLDPARTINHISAVDVMQFTGGLKPIFGLNFDNIQYAMAYNLNLLFYPLLLFILAILFFFSNRAQLMAVWRNARWPQLFYHSGLLSIGLGLGYLAYPDNLELNFYSVLAALDILAAVWLAWTASVVINDIYDFEVDAVSNPERPLPKNIFTVAEYTNLGAVIFLLSVLGGLVVDFRFAGLLLVYQFIAWAYSAQPFRLKRFPGVATAMSAAASLVVLFMGFTLFSGAENLNGLSWRIVWLILISLTLSLPIKDFKDIEGDRKYGVYTVPVIFGQEKGRLIVAGGVFLSFILSVFLLNESRLFWWASAFGGAAFLIITNPKIKNRQLFWWILLPVSFYGLSIVKIIFLQ